MILLLLTYFATQTLAQEQQKQQLEACIFLTRSFLQKRSTQINQFLLKYNEEQRLQANNKLHVTLAQLCSQDIEQSDIEKLYKSDPKRLNLDEFLHLFEDYHIPHIVNDYDLQLKDHEKDIQKIFEWYERQNEIALEEQKKNNDKVKENQKRQQDEDLDDLQDIPQPKQRNAKNQQKQEQNNQNDHQQQEAKHENLVDEQTDIFEDVYVNSIIGIAFGVFFDYFFSNSIKDFLKTIFNRKKPDQSKNSSDQKEKSKTS